MTRGLSFYSVLFLVRLHDALEFFTSSGFPTYVRDPLSLELLARAEIEFAESLNDSLQGLSESQRLLASEYLRIFDGNTKSLRGFSKAQSLEQKVDAITWNSISIFQHVHRWLNHLKPLLELPDSTRVFHHLQEFKGYTNEDLIESMMDILNILHVYNYDVPLAVQGALGDLVIGAELGTEQCLELAGFARELSYHALSIEFYEEALAKAGSSLQREEIESLLNVTIKEHDDLVRQKTLHPLLKQFLFNRRIAPLIKRHGREKLKLVRIYQRMQIPWLPLKNMPYIEKPVQKLGLPHAHDICLNRGLQTEEEKRSLFCWYDSTIDPYFVVNPLKMELLSEKPELIQIYEVNAKKRIKSFKDVYSKRNNYSDLVVMEHGLHVQNSVETVLEYQDIFRVPMEPKILSAFQTRDSNSEDSSLFQIHAYTPGSKFNRHYDLPFRFSKPEKGVALSVLHYLEEPELGGETMFLYPRVTVKPIAGSTLIFINSLNGGSVDFETAHGSCPVLLGRKYVVAKYVYLHTLNPQCSKFTFGKFKLYPKSKILNQKLYPRLEKYLENENQAGMKESHSV